jgi:hypothetical protein
VLLAQEKYSPVTQDTQIVSQELKAVLVEKRLVFADSWWPADLVSRAVSSADIPKEVLTKTTTWLRTMLKAQWLPDDPNIWMVGVRKDVPLKADYLVLRYKVEGRTIQIQEDGSAVRVLIDTGSQSEMKPEVFLTDVVKAFLRFPQDKLAALRFYMERLEHDGVPVWHGTMDCDFDRYDREAYFKRTWYNHTDVWTDGRRAFFSLVEMDGQPPKRKQVHPGIARRFKPAK